jgi:hypothetical protein
MYIFLDVDGTIACDNQALYLSLCNLALKLGIDEERLVGLTYDEFYALPEVTAYREQVGEQRYNTNIRIIAHTPILQRHLEVVDGAINGARFLAKSGNLCYCTARKTARFEELDEAMARATREWLEASGFPNPQDVIFCTSLLEKLSFCAAHIGKTGEEVVLVDDSYERLLSEFKKLVARQRTLLQQHFTLLAFGAQEAPEHAPFHVAALPMWDQIEQVTQHIDKGEKEAYVHA